MTGFDSYPEVPSGGGSHHFKMALGLVEQRLKLEAPMFLQATGTCLLLRGAWSRDTFRGILGTLGSESIR